jgi:chloramphenicol-sensitive protein RarD
VATGESLTALRIASFAFIWGGALVFAAAAFFRQRAARRALRASAEPI